MWAQRSDPEPVDAAGPGVRVRHNERVRPSTQPITLPADLVSAIDRAGYHPAIVRDVVAAGLGDDPVLSHLVHLETTFDHEAVRRHITVLVLTRSRLLIVHTDDHQDDHGGPHGAMTATATSEVIPLRDVRGVMLTHVIPDPEKYVPGSLGRELTLTLGWGAVARVEPFPGACGDQTCDADHGYDGTITSDDIALRISADADGDSALAAAMAFAKALTSALGRTGE